MRHPSDVIMNNTRHPSDAMNVKFITNWAQRKSWIRYSSRRLVKAAVSCRCMDMLIRSTEIPQSQCATVLSRDFPRVRAKRAV